MTCARAEPSVHYRLVYAKKISVPDIALSPRPTDIWLPTSKQAGALILANTLASYDACFLRYIGTQKSCRQTSILFLW